MNTTPHRIRVRFSKQGSLCFIGHLDLQSLFERALRRSGLPLRYSEGFNQRVRINLASALPLGFSSVAELLDFWLDEPVEPACIQEQLDKALPQDLRVITVTEVSNALPSLQASLSASVYEITFSDSLEPLDLHQRLTSLLDQDTIPFQRRKKTVDIKPMIESYVWESDAVLRLVLSSRPEANGRPDELLQLMDVDPVLCVIERKELVFIE